MTVYNDCLTIILKDGRVIVCLPNGYTVRTLLSGSGKHCKDKEMNDYGCSYWKKQAMLGLGVTLEDVAMQAKNSVIFTN